MPAGRLLPHGLYSFVPAVLTTFGWLLSLYEDGCDFAKLSGEIVARVAIQPNVPWLLVGFQAYREPSLSPSGSWEIEYSSQCLIYHSDQIQQDGIWKLAKGLLFMASVLGGASTFFTWFATCCTFSKATWRLAGYEVLSATIFNSLSFVWFKNSICQDPGNYCDLSWGSRTDIGASILWFAAALSILCYYPAVRVAPSSGDGVIVDPTSPMRHPMPPPNAELSLSDGPPSSPSASHNQSPEPKYDDHSTPSTTASGEDSSEERGSRINQIV